MKKWILSTLLVAVIATLVFAFMPARQVQAGCGTILSGSFGTNSNYTTPNFAVLAGDVITATVVDNPGTATGIGVDITINGTTYNAGVTGNGSRTSQETVPASGTASVFMYNNMGTGGTLNWTITISGVNCPNVVLPAFTDGRVNPQAWATAVIYCRDGAIDVYDVDDESVGRLLFVVTPEEIAEVGVPATNNALIESGNGVRGFVGLYRVASGEFIIAAPDSQPGKDYTFTFAGC
jgi:hypothetical protein